MIVIERVKVKGQNWVKKKKSNCAISRVIIMEIDYGKNVINLWAVTMYCDVGDTYSVSVQGQPPIGQLTNKK